MSPEKRVSLGHKVRRLRRDLDLTQTKMAKILGISNSYINLIEHNQRPVTLPLLFKLGNIFKIDLKHFAQDDAASLASTVREVFADPLFEGLKIEEQEIMELVAISPIFAEAIIKLFKSYSEMKEDTKVLIERFTDPEKFRTLDPRVFPIEEVRDFQQSNLNYFPELENAAEAIYDEAGLEGGDIYRGLVRYLETNHGIGTKIMPVDLMGETLRRYDFHRCRVLLSEMLPMSGRIFHLAVQVGLSSQGILLDQLVETANFSSNDAKNVCRISLAGAFAGAVMMPYDKFLNSAKELRYDIEILQKRFSVSFEQVCHRLTTLQRPGSKGVPFFFIRLDNAGNISKRLSGGDFRFARFGGDCPRWIVHDVFNAPGVIHTQHASMPGGDEFLTIARTINPILRGFHHRQPRLAVALGCDIEDAVKLIYADRINIQHQSAVSEIGVSCRVCERLDCGQRAHPPLNHRLRLDESVRRIAPFGIAPN